VLTPSTRTRAVGGSQQKNQKQNKNLVLHKHHNPNEKEEEEEKDALGGFGVEDFFEWLY
jgi:hypothetical protein